MPSCPLGSTVEENATHFLHHWVLKFSLISVNFTDFFFFFKFGHDHNPKGSSFNFLFFFFFFGHFKTKICRFIGVFTCPLCSRLKVFKKNYLSTYIFGCAGSSLLRAGFLYLWRRLFSSCGVWASRCFDFSCSGAWALGAQASVVVAQELSCPKACGIFPEQGSNPCPLCWQADF